MVAFLSRRSEPERLLEILKDKKAARDRPAHAEASIVRILSGLHVPDAEDIFWDHVGPAHPAPLRAAALQALPEVTHVAPRTRFGLMIQYTDSSTIVPEDQVADESELTDEQIFAKKTLEELNAERPLADVYFDLDQSTLRDDARSALARNAEYLKRWTSTRISVEGHCDERATTEYNLGLGERRAAAVRDYLVSLGIGTDRIAIVSKGEESPFCTESNESCWQQNRRGHFVITAK